MGFSRQEYWSGLPFPSPGDLPDPGIKSGSPTFQADALTSEPPGKPCQVIRQNLPRKVVVLVKSLSCVRFFVTPQTSLPGSSVHWIIQARTLEQVAIFFSRGSSWLKNQTRVFSTAGRLSAELGGKPSYEGAIYIVVCSASSLAWQGTVNLQSQDRTRDRKARSRVPQTLEEFQ